MSDYGSYLNSLTRISTTCVHLWSRYSTLVYKFGTKSTLEGRDTIDMYLYKILHNVIVIYVSYKRTRTAY